MKVETNVSFLLTVDGVVSGSENVCTKVEYGDAKKQFD
jgi:hypothetical protein